MVEEQKVIAGQTEGEEPQTATQTEDLASLKVTLAKLETELEQTKKGLSTAHQTLTQKDRELKTQSDLRAEIQGIREDMELLAVGLATKDEVETADGTNRQQVLAELQKRRADAETKRKLASDAIARQEYNQRADTIYAHAKTLFEGQEEKLEDIEDLLKMGNIERAEKRLARAMKDKTAVLPVKNEETEDERIERLVKEKLEARYPGVYSSDTGGSSGVGRGSITEAMSLYIQGKITAEEAQKRGAKF